MFRVSVGDYELCCHDGELPDMTDEYRRRAVLTEEFGTSNEPGCGVCFVSVGRSGQWPTLVVVQRFSPARNGFNPGVLITRNTHRLFIGAGRRLLCYDLTRPARLWEDEAECGFWWVPLPRSPSLRCNCRCFGFSRSVTHLFREWLSV